MLPKKKNGFSSPIIDAVLRRIHTLRLPKGAKILDAPCGTGELAVSLQGMGFEVWGADINSAAQVHLDEHFCIADLNKRLPWPDESFDLIVSIEGIEHLENQFGFLRELHRVSRSEGKIILTTPNIISLRSRVRFFGSGFYHLDPRPLNESERHPLHHIGLLTFPELRYLLHTSGFRLIEVSQAHTKAVSYLYAIFVPWMWLYTVIAFRKEKDRLQRERNREIRRTLFSSSLLFSENLLLLADTNSGAS